LLAWTRTGARIIFIALESDLHTGDQGEGLYVAKIRLELNHKLYEGVEISTRVGETRDLNLFELKFKEATNQMIFVKPAMEACFRFDKVVVDRRLQLLDGHESLIIGRDAARVAFEKKVLKKPDLLKRTFDVELPAGYKLSQGPFNDPTGRPGEFITAISRTIIFGSPFRPSGGADNSYHTFLSWRFINLSSEVDLRLAGNDAAAAAQLADDFGGL
jgi:hypothetical protein